MLPIRASISTSTLSEAMAGATLGSALCVSSNGVSIDAVMIGAVLVEGSDAVPGVDALNCAVGPDARPPSTGRSFLGRIRLKASPSSCAMRLICR